MNASYEQATGLLVLHTANPFRAVGYSGKGIGKNNPNLQAVHNVGPIPRGAYRVSAPFTHPQKGPLCFRLTPEGQEMFGRSGFLIHGDSREHPGAASEGCIILPQPARQVLAAHQLTRLFVSSFLQREIAA
jgi:hypothetical protein